MAADINPFRVLSGGTGRVGWVPLMRFGYLNDVVQQVRWIL